MYIFSGSRMLESIVLVLLLLHNITVIGNGTTACPCSEHEEVDIVDHNGETYMCSGQCHTTFTCCERLDLHGQGYFLELLQGGSEISLDNTSKHVIHVPRDDDNCHSVRLSSHYSNNGTVIVCWLGGRQQYKYMVKYYVENSSSPVRAPGHTSNESVEVNGTTETASWNRHIELMFSLPTLVVGAVIVTVVVIIVVVCVIRSKKKGPQDQPHDIKDPECPPTNSLGDSAGHGDNLSNPKVHQQEVESGRKDSKYVIGRSNFSVRHILPNSATQRVSLESIFCCKGEPVFTSPGPASFTKMVDDYGGELVQKETTAAVFIQPSKPPISNDDEQPHFV